MNVYDDRFYGFTRRLMISIGLWPYQNPRYRKFLWALISFVQIQSIIFQYMSVITHRYDIKMFIELISFNSLLLSYFIKYNTIYFNSTNVKLLLEQINRDCNAITDIREIEIIQKYASRGRLYTIYSGLFVYPCTMAFLFTLCIPDVLDLTMPLSEPRPREFPFPVECFLDQQKYFYVLMSFLLLITMLGMTILMASETFLMIVVQHACGLFAITSYRIIRAFDDCEKASVIKARLSCAVRIHRQSLQFIEFMNSCFGASYMFLAVVAVISIIANMLQLFRAIESNIAGDIFNYGLYLLAHFCYLFWVNYFGQNLSDHSESIFQDTYNARWYVAPLHAQKLLLIILQRSIRKCIFNIFGGLLIASMDGFASIVSLSVSYFTMLYALRP